jgi:quercetin 2,3-dioxygenase
MTAGRGIIHSEMPEKGFALKVGKFHGLQLCVNLLKSDKVTASRYQDLRASNIPTVQRSDGNVSTKVIAGTAM